MTKKKKVEIVVDPGNARVHDERNQQVIQESLRELGAGRSIVIDKAGQVIAGNETYRQAKALGLPVKIVESDGRTLIVVQRKDLAPEDERRRALAIADNRSSDLSEFDMGILANTLKAAGPELRDAMGFTEKELAQVFRQAQPKDLKDPPAPAAPEEPRAKPGQLFALGAHRLLCGDATKKKDVKKLFGEDRPALIITSPPYNQSIDKFKPSGMHKEADWVSKVQRLAYADSLPEGEYQNLQSALLNQWHGLLLDGGSLFYNHKNRYRDKAVVSPLGWVPGPFKLRQEIVWRRPGSVTQNARMFLPSDERIYWMYKGADFFFDDTTEIKSWSSVWEISPSTNKSHAVAFPIEIPSRAIRACSKSANIIYDPFLGSGTTLIAADQLDRVCCGLEIDPGYCDVIIQRYCALKEIDPESVYGTATGQGSMGE